jgi:hypothetical protein
MRWWGIRIGIGALAVAALATFSFPRGAGEPAPETPPVAAAPIDAIFDAPFAAGSRAPLDLDVLGAPPAPALQPIPEPGTAPLVLLGIALLARLARRSGACHPAR